MSRRRRQTIDRNPLSRVELWDRKLEPETYRTYLTAVKPIALRKFSEYQCIHESLIKIVKDVISKYPNETTRQHAYMWYAQGIWYCTQRYKDDALRKEANALFMYWLMLGLREEPLREIAIRLGVKIDDWNYLLDPIAMPIANIVKKSIDELLIERRVYEILERSEYIPAYIEPYINKIEISEEKEYEIIDTTKLIELPIIHLVDGFVDATRSNVDLIFNYYIKTHIEANFIPYYSITISQTDLKYAVYIQSRPSFYGIKITVKPSTVPSTPFTIYYTIFIKKVK